MLKFLNWNRVYVSLIFLKVNRLRIPVQARDIIGQVSVRRAVQRFNFYGVLQHTIK